MAKKQGNAPERNRVKRIVRELMRAGEGVFPNGAYLIYCSGPCETLHHEELKSAILAIMDSLCAGARSESQEDEACI
jgi:ribonuclease P protein component